MLELDTGPHFKASWKKLEKKRYDYAKLKAVTDLLVNEQPLPGKYHDHSLHGDKQGCNECHIEDNWLLIYTKTATTITLIRTGSHDDLY
jgi:mRNA interferase YafQ